DAEHLALLEHAEELRLEIRAHLADLVEEEGPTLRALEAAGARRGGAGEGALLAAEELALEDALGERLAVDRDEGLSHAVRPVVEEARHQLLPRAALALHQHRRLRGRDAADEREHLLAPRARGDHRLRRVAARDLGAEPAVLALQAVELERAA